MVNGYNCTNQVPANYSGVTINITNPALNIPPQQVYCSVQDSSASNQSATGGQNLLSGKNGYQGAIVDSYSQNSQSSRQAEEYYKAVQSENVQGGYTANPIYQNNDISEQQRMQTSQPYYPPQYYMNNYNYNIHGGENPAMPNDDEYGSMNQIPAMSGADKQDKINDKTDNGFASIPRGNQVEGADDTIQEVNTDTSKEIIEELDARAAEQKELEKNSAKTKVVSLTNEYIMSLENYLNNPNLDIRLMAAKDILTRLDEDRDRYDDAALNALLNKMLQDPAKLVRVAAMSALASELASGNDYTVELLNKIQQNPQADPEDVLEASQILLKRSATTEIRYVPLPQHANEEQKAVTE